MTKDSSSPKGLLSRFLPLFFRLLYHQFAWTYDLVAATVSVGMWNSWVLSTLPYLHGPRLLELGHGPGHLQAALARKDLFVAGLDESRDMGRRAFRRLSRLRFTPRLVSGYAQALPFMTAFFDQVVATFPTDFILEPRTLREIFRILTPGGSLVILPLAWITGQNPFHRMAAAIFRITGEAPDWQDRFSQPLIEAGFLVEIEHIFLENSHLVFVRAGKPLKYPQSTPAIGNLM